MPFICDGCVLNHNSNVHTGIFGERQLHLNVRVSKLSFCVFMEHELFGISWM